MSVEMGDDILEANRELKLQQSGEVELRLSQDFNSVSQFRVCILWSAQLKGADVTMLSKVPS